MINWIDFHAWRRKRLSIDFYGQSIKGQPDYLKRMAIYQRRLDVTLRIIDAKRA